MFKKLALQGMQCFPGSHSLDRFDGAPLGFYSENQARAGKSFVEHDAARTAVTGATAFLHTLQVQFVAEHFEERLAWFAEELLALAKTVAEAEEALATHPPEVLE